MPADTREDALRRLQGVSPGLRAIRRDIERLAPLDTTVLLTGETGVGKGVAARALHALSDRRGAFVHADCASLPRTLFESELFGHERGAFTGALARRVGRFERAAGGTLFLDEVGELARPLQTALLHVLQDRSFERVGGSAPIAMRARVVAATSRDLPREVRSGRFRADLYFRLAVARIELPPLRARPEDVAPIAAAALARIARRLAQAPPVLGDEALAALAAHPWPGNVRELENALERLAIRCPGRPVGPGDLDAALESLPWQGWTAAGGEPAVVRDRHADDRIVRALAETGGNVARAARRLGLPRTTLRRRMSRLSARGASVGDDPGETLEHQEVERDQRQRRLVEAREPQLGDPPQDPGAEPGAGDAAGADQGEREGERQEREARRPEYHQLGQVTEGLARRLGPDDLVARQTQVQEEGRDQRSGGADRHVEQPNHRAEDEEAPVAVGALGVRAQQQDTRSPGRQQHEGADQRAGHRGRQALREEQAGESHRQERQRVAPHDAGVDVLALEHAARGVRHQLDHAVQRDRLQGIHEQQHHRQQHHAAGHAEDGGQHRGRERHGDEDGEDGGLHGRERG
jgi:transcriptional regulator with AAA-type ATPase domain